MIGKFFVIGCFVACGVSACSPRLAGTWTITNYNVTEGEQSGVSVSNIGSITFNKDHSGEKSIHYSIFQNNYEDKRPFTWVQDNDATIRIEGENSDFSKTWLIVENKRKKQVWKSTDGANKVQELNLEKQ